MNGFGPGFCIVLRPVFGLSESRDNLGRSSCSWDEDEEDSDKREDMERDSRSKSLSNGRLNE
jgi:hypothetical protein